MTTTPRARRSRGSRPPTVVKLGGELLEEPARLRRIARTLAALAAREPVVVIHGGGREVDAWLARLKIPKRAIDGLRITDDATLDVVVGVLAGQVNTRLVAALNAAGANAVGLTGADAALAPVRRARAYRAANGDRVDLGRVGLPRGTERPTLLGHLLGAGYVPVVASISAGTGGHLYNVNADTLAGHLAGRLAARRLVIAGATAGVLDPDGRTRRVVDRRTVTRLIAAAEASAGMVAKLEACLAALRAGVHDVRIVDGRRARPGWLDRPVGATAVTA